MLILRHWAWLSLVVLISIDSHTGTLPWCLSVDNIFPCCGGTRHHDTHHAYPIISRSSRSGQAFEQTGRGAVRKGGEEEERRDEEPGQSGKRAEQPRVPTSERLVSA